MSSEMKEDERKNHASSLLSRSVAFVMIVLTFISVVILLSTIQVISLNHITIGTAIVVFSAAMAVDPIILLLQKRFSDKRDKLVRPEQINESKKE